MNWIPWAQGSTRVEGGGVRPRHMPIVRHFVGYSPVHSLPSAHHEDPWWASCHGNFILMILLETVRAAQPVRTFWRKISCPCRQSNLGPAAYSLYPTARRPQTQAANYSRPRAALFPSYGTVRTVNALRATAIWDVLVLNLTAWRHDGRCTGSFESITIQVLQTLNGGEKHSNTLCSSQYTV